MQVQLIELMPLEEIPLRELFNKPNLNISSNVGPHIQFRDSSKTIIFLTYDTKILFFPFVYIRF